MHRSDTHRQSPVPVRRLQREIRESPSPDDRNKKILRTYRVRLGEDKSIAPHASGRTRPGWSLRLLALRRQIRAGAVGDFSRHSDRLAQRRMRMNRLADVDRVGPHFNCERNLTDQIASVRADNAATDDAMR